MTLWRHYIGTFTAVGDANLGILQGFFRDVRYVPPRQGAEVTRDEQRPYEITEVRRQEDGQLNVFVREIMQPN